MHMSSCYKSIAYLLPAMALGLTPATYAETQRVNVSMGDHHYTVTIIRSDANEFPSLSREILNSTGAFYVSEIVKRGTLLDRKRIKGLTPDERAEQDKSIENKLRKTVGTLIDGRSSLITVGPGINSKKVSAMMRLVRPSFDRSGVRPLPAMERVKAIHPLIGQLLDLQAQGPLSELKNFVVKREMDGEVRAEQEILLFHFVANELSFQATPGLLTGATPGNIMIETDPGAHSRLYEYLFGFSTRFPVVADPDFDKELAVMAGKYTTVLRQFRVRSTYFSTILHGLLPFSVASVASVASKDELALLESESSGKLKRPPITEETGFSLSGRFAQEEEPFSKKISKNCALRFKEVSAKERRAR